MAERELRVCALYPDLMNIYADRGNLLLLERRCQWRGIGFSVQASGLGDELDPQAADLYYIGGGQDRDQRLCALDLAEVKRDALHSIADRGGVILAVCGGYQLLGHSYQLERRVAPRCRARRPPYGPRGRAAADRQRRDRGRARARAPQRPGRIREPRWAHPPWAGSSTPLGKVLKGYGNNGSDGREGVIAGNVIGTYLHGPLLPKNAWFADWLIATALGLPEPLPELDDGLEAAAHADARRAAGL